MKNLFKLFGYLEKTHSINVKGVGLGLHICKLILGEFGGEIICKSEWGLGTNFVLLLPLYEKTQNNVEIARVQNPIKFTYPKI